MTTWNKLGRVATTVGTRETVYGQKWRVVTYHATEVVTWDDDLIVLNSGGWHTVTAKCRMNQASRQFDLGFSVYQKKHLWFVDYKGETLSFYDGITLAR